MFVWSPHLQAQTNSALFWEWVSRQPASGVHMVEVLSEDEVITWVQDGEQALKNRGYLQVQIEYQKRGSSYEFRCLAGPKYQWTSLSRGNLPDSVINHLTGPGLGALSYGEAIQWQQQIVGYYADRGYPFAQAGFTAVTVTADSLLSGQWAVDPGFVIRYAPMPDSTGIRLRAQKLAQLVEMKPGALYRESALAAAPQRLQAYPYLRMSDTPRVYFANQKAHVDIPLAPVKANAFDGILGIFPRAEGGPPLWVGALQMTLWNPLGFGSHYNVKWERPQPTTQRLSLQAEWFYVAGLPLHVHTQFSLWKQDSAFLQQQVQVQFLSPPGVGSFQWGGYAKYFSVAPLADNTPWLPGEAISATQSVIGGLLRWNTPQAHDWQPRQNIQGQVGAGIRATESSQFFWEVEAEGAFFRPFSPLWGVYGKVEGGWKPGVSAGEAFRLGGFQRLRGFNEQELYAVGYGIGTAELRLRTGHDSFLALLVDQAWWQSPPLATGQWATGLGIGTQWRLAPGILRVYWATGQVANQRPFSLETSKIHVGFVGQF